METRFQAVFRDGVFVPEEPFALPDGCRVQLVIEHSALIAPRVSDPEERDRIIERTIERMKANPLPPDAPRFTREELHQRR